MTEALPRSAVAVLETQDKQRLILQRRPNLSGKLAYAGKIHLLGGGGKPDETFAETVARKLSEETNLRPKADDMQLLDEVYFVGEDKNRNPIERHVGLFSLQVVSFADVELREQGELVAIPRTPESLFDYKDELTPFAHHALERVILGETQWP
jgi:8-oxo-dGTP pyrophosphatase MutT (NUDIX family)